MRWSITTASSLPCDRSSGRIGPGNEDPPPLFPAQGVCDDEPCDLFPCGRRWIPVRGGYFRRAGRTVRPGRLLRLELLQRLLRALLRAELLCSRLRALVLRSGRLRAELLRSGRLR